jgi:hypothetical protein
MTESSSTWATARGCTGATFTWCASLPAAWSGRCGSPVMACRPQNDYMVNLLMSYVSGRPFLASCLVTAIQKMVLPVIRCLVPRVSPFPDCVPAWHVRPIDPPGRYLLAGGAGERYADTLTQRHPAFPLVFHLDLSFPARLCGRAQQHQTLNHSTNNPGWSELPGQPPG